MPRVRLNRKLTFDHLESRCTPALDFATAFRFGGTAVDDSAADIAVDNAGNMYVVGSFSDTVDFDPGPGIVNLTATTTSNAYVAKYNSTGQLQWVKQAGGALKNDAFAVDLDTNGNPVIAATTWGSTDFDPGPNSFPLNSNGASDVVIWKLDSNGNFVFAKMVGGSTWDTPRALTLDLSNNIYVTGDFWASTVDFDPGAGVHNLTGVAFSEIFALKLDANGNFVWARATSGSSGANANSGNAIAVDESGNVLITGKHLANTNFNPGGTAANIVSAGGNDAFLWKLNANGTHAWVRGMGGTITDVGTSVVVDTAGNAYIAGRYDGPANFGSFTLQTIVKTYVAKVDTNGNFVWARSTAGNPVLYEGDLAISNGALFIVGQFTGTQDFDPSAGVANLTAQGSDIYLEQVHSGTGGFVNVWQMGGNGAGTNADKPAQLTNDSAGNLYLTGSFVDTSDFDPRPANTSSLSSTGFADVFALKLLFPPLVGPTLTGNAIAENQAVGSSVGTLSSSGGSGGTTYTLVAGAGSTDNASFAIVGSQLSTNAIFNFEARSSYSIRVRATDAGGQVSERVFTIQVTNVNEAPTNIILSDTSFEENQPANTTVGLLSTIDPDANQTFTYSFIGGTGSEDNGSFNLNGNVLRANSLLDFETKNSYSIRVRSVDQNSLAIEIPITINVVDTPEPPTDITLSANTVAENSALGTTIGTFSTADLDSATHVYTLVAGPGSDNNAQFSIVGNQLKVGQLLDFEAGTTRTLRVRSTDPTNRSVDRIFTVSVTNIQEAPTSLALSPASLAEHAPANTVVGTLSAFDSDGTTNFTYQFVAGFGDTDNARFTIVGNQVRSLQSFKFVDGIRRIRVKVTDPTNRSFSTAIIVTVTNVNEKPTNVTLSRSTLNENVPVGTIVGTFSTADPDPGDRFTYSLVFGTGSTDNGLFLIDSAGRLSTRGAIDFEKKPSLSLRVRSKDQGGLSIDKVLTISVVNLNEPPTNIVPASRSIFRNGQLTFSRFVGTEISVTDPDAGAAGDLRMTVVVSGGTLRLARTTGLSPVTGNGTARVVFQGTQGELRSALAGAVFSATPGFVGIARLTISTTDFGRTGLGGTKTDTDVVSINVVNRAPSVPLASGMPNLFEYRVSRNSSLNVAAAQGLVRGRRDADGDVVTTVLSANPRNGTLFLRTNGSFVYRPRTGFVGDDVFRFRYYDGKATSRIVSVVVHVL